MPNSTPGIVILNELYDKFDITIKLQILRRFWKWGHSWVLHKWNLIKFRLTQTSSYQKKPTIEFNAITLPNFWTLCCMFHEMWITQPIALLTWTTSPNLLFAIFGLTNILLVSCYCSTDPSAIAEFFGMWRSSDCLVSLLYALFIIVSLLNVMYKPLVVN